MRGTKQQLAPRFHPERGVWSLGRRMRWWNPRSPPPQPLAPYPAPAPAPAAGFGCVPAGPVSGQSKAWGWGAEGHDPFQILKGVSAGTTESKSCGCKWESSRLPGSTSAPSRGLRPGRGTLSALSLGVPDRGSRGRQYLRVSG